MGTINVLDADPEFAAGLSPGRAAVARRAAVAQTRWFEAGPVSPEALVVPGGGAGAALLVVEGLVVKRLKAAGRHSVALFGTGDLIRAWQANDYESSAVPSEAGWSALQRTRVALIDRRFARATAHWPEIAAALLDRALEQAEPLRLRLALAQEPKLAVRLLLLFWHLAERWGYVERRGVVLPFRLSHEFLAELAGAQRPSVSVALSELAQQGAVLRRDTGEWLLPGAEDRFMATLGRTSPVITGSALTVARLSTYEALVEAVGSSPGTLVDPTRAAWAADDLARRYPLAPRGVRRRVNTVLDWVEGDAATGTFSAATVPERLEHLLGRLQSTGAAGADAPPDWRATEAVALAAAPFDPRGWTWSATSVELWVKTALAARRSPDPRRDRVTA